MARGRGTSLLVVLSIVLAIGPGCGARAEDVGAPDAPAVTEKPSAEQAAPANGNAKPPQSPQAAPDPNTERFASAFRVGKPPFEPGEELIYTLKWSGIAAGRASLKVTDVPEGFKGHKVLRLDSFTESNAFVDAFYSVRDVSYSLVDAEQGFSRYYYLDKKEGRHQFIDTIEFDYDAKVGRYKRTEKGREDSKEIPLYGYMADPVSVVFYYRSFELKMGDVVDVPLSTARKNYVTKWKVSEKALMKVRDLGTVRALKIVPAEEIKDGPAISKGESHLWLEEKTRIPLRVTCDMPFGSVTMVLVQGKNVDGLEALDSKAIRAAKKEGYK